MGDMPYMLSRDSVEVWLYPSIFQLDMNLGTAPGYTTKKGEDWGLPPYDWNHIEANHFKYFKGRLLSLSHYFDLYRIDHCQGFFNQFIIPKGGPPSAGSNEITDKQSMLEAGKRRLTALANLAPMLPIAEDLRFDASQKKIIEALGIPGVNIFVWMNRALPLSNLSIFGKDFNLMTITKLSNHDLPPIRTWWKDNPPLARALTSKMDWKYHVELNSQEQLQLLWWQMHSSSLLHIEFLQDILPPNIGGNSSDLRINFPGTNNE